MLYVGKASEAAPGNPYYPANWEDDVCDISLEVCDLSEDPMGYCVMFYRQSGDEANHADDGYRVGASYLQSRLRKLTRAGFDAPMTKKAIGLLSKKSFTRL